MKKLSLPCFLIACALLGTSLASYAQAPGSSNTENTTRYVGGIRTTLGEILYIGPNARITIDGTWHVYSKYVWISPLAQIGGNGTLIIHNSSEEGGSGGPTIVDGNDNQFIDVNVVHANNQGMEIKNVPLAASLAASGWANPTSQSTVKIGKDFNLSVNGADVTLDATSGVTGDFSFDANATLSNYRPERMVITNNSVQSHLVKLNPTASFVFPVGIADGDYTPAQVQGNGNIHVSVQNFSASSSNEGLLAGGPDRTWHVFADTETTATVALQHNTVTDISPFNSANDHFLTQYAGTTWSLTGPEPGNAGTFTTGSALPGASMQDLTAVSIPNAGSSNSSYITKTNIQPLPVTLVAFNATREAQVAKLTWSTTVETNFDHFEVERSHTGTQWYMVGIVQPKHEKSYSFSNFLDQYGTYLYRLKMVDKDGTSSYSKIRSVQYDSPANQKVTFYPNPAASSITFSDAVKEVVIFNGEGKRLLQSTSAGMNSLDVNELSDGLYLVQITGVNGTVHTQRIIIKK